MKVRKLNPSQGALSPDDARISGEELGLDEQIYRKLSSLTDNKSLVEPTGPDSEFDRFLIEMEKIHSGEAVSEAITLLDKYLGNLGDTADYPFRDDTYVSEAWLDVNAQDVSRNVIYDNLGTDDNVITTIDGTDYNIIHAT